MLLGLVVIPRTPALQEAEDTLSLALLGLVVGTRPAVTSVMVLEHLQECFGITRDVVSVWRTRPDDFIARFSRQEDLDRVLAAQPLPGAPFVVCWRRWRRLIMASAGTFCYKVLVTLKGVPSHARSTEVAQGILGSTCAKPEFANPEALEDPNDERELFVAACYAHPDLVPNEIILVIPEPEEENDGGSTLYLRPHEIIHHDLLALCYLVQIRLVEFQDWHTPPTSSDEGFDGDDDYENNDSNYNGFHPGFQSRDSAGSWPRTIIVGDVACLVISVNGTIPYRCNVNASPAMGATRGKLGLDDKLTSCFCTGTRSLLSKGLHWTHCWLRLYYQHR
jgi:hypothetical protein